MMKIEEAQQESILSSPRKLAHDFIHDHICGILQERNCHSGAEATVLHRQETRHTIRSR